MANRMLRGGMTNPMQSVKPQSFGTLSYVPNQRVTNHTNTMRQVTQYEAYKQMQSAGAQDSAGAQGVYSATLG